MQAPDLSVVMPSYNEEKAIGQMIAEIKKHSAGLNCEILVVDSSSDKTPEIARSMGAKVITQPPSGHGNALKAAIKAASGNIIITSDCDNTYPMEFIPELTRVIKEDGFQLISCNRLNPTLNEAMPFINHFGNWMFAFLVRLLYGIKTHDVTTGMFCMTKEASEKINLENNYSLPCEIILKAHIAGLKYKEIDIPYKNRTGVTTLNKWHSGKAYLRCIFKYKFRLSIPASRM